VYNYADENNMAFRGHTAMWANVGSSHYYPDFIGNETDPEKIEKFLKNYIQTTVGRYAGRGISWDVVNEAIDPNSGSG